MTILRTASGLLAGLAFTAMTAAAANATIVTVFDGVAAGRTSFNNTVTAAGAVVNNTVLTGLSSGAVLDAGDFTIASNSGFTSVTSYNSLSGQVIEIDPSTTAPGGSNPRTDPMDYFASGLTFVFDTAINAIGFEVGDWSTCCFSPTTDLFISFDNGAPILVGSATTGQLFPSQVSGASVFEIFVAAFDDTGSFTTVSFWGNGLGEVLVAGGDIRYALLDEGTLPPSTIPLPAGGWLMIAGLGGLAALRRRKA